MYTNPPQYEPAYCLYPYIRWLRSIYLHVLRYFFPDLHAVLLGMHTLKIVSALVKSQRNMLIMSNTNLRQDWPSCARKKQGQVRPCTIVHPAVFCPAPYHAPLTPGTRHCVVDPYGRSRVEKLKAQASAVNNSGNTGFGGNEGETVCGFSWWMIRGLCCLS